MRLWVIKVNKDLLETGLYSCTSLKIIKPMVKMTVVVVIGQGEKNYSSINLMNIIMSNFTSKIFGVTYKLFSLGLITQ